MPVTFIAYGSESDTGARDCRAIRFRTKHARSRTTSRAACRRRTSGDRHLLMIDRDRWLLYETYATRWNASRGAVGSGVRRGVRSEPQRSPSRWLDIGRRGRPRDLPRADPLRRGVRRRPRSRTRSASRRAATNGYVWPASHAAGSQRERAADGRAAAAQGRPQDISGFTPEVQRIFRAMKRYGLIVADNGIGHVHQRHDGCAVEQRRAQPGVQRADGRRLRGRAARMEADRHTRIAPTNLRIVRVVCQATDSRRLPVAMPSILAAIAPGAASPL